MSPGRVHNTASLSGGQHGDGAKHRHSLLPSDRGRLHENGNMITRLKISIFESRELFLEFKILTFTDTH